MIRAFVIFLGLPTLAFAQSLPATHAHSGLNATSARTRIERDAPKVYGPRFEAAGMAAANFEYVSNRQSGGTEAASRVLSPIRVVKPPFRLPERDLGIADQHDVLFFAESRLVRIRVHLKSAGSPLAKGWTDQLRTYFEFLDRDNNGELNRHEAEFALSNAGVAQMIQTGYAYQRPDDAVRTFAEIDIDQDRKIQFDEFAFYHAPSAGRIVTAMPNPVRDPYADTLTDELFKLFDTDKDGRLSRKELTAVEEMFSTRDADEDECLTALEIVPNILGTSVQPRPVPVAKDQPSAQPMLAFRTGTVPESLLETILNRYDKDKNLRLSRTENPFTPEQFQALDRDRSGELGVTELLHWNAGIPDIELDMIHGTKENENAIRVRPAADGKPVPLAAMFRAAGNDGAVISIGTQSIQLSCSSPRGIYVPVQRPGALSFPDNGKGFVTEKDIVGPQYQSIRVLFDMIDRDADGKMSRTEFDRFFAVQQSFTKLPLSLVYGAHTPSFFQLLDANGDGRLSAREARNVWDRLRPLEPVEKGYITRAALQPQGSLRFSRSADLSLTNPAAFYTQQPSRQNTRGPIWFRKLDRNGDGELSRSEFPGRRDEFKKLDADQDGYIGFEEAAAADRSLRTGK